MKSKVVLLIMLASLIGWSMILQAAAEDISRDVISSGGTEATSENYGLRGTISQNAANSGISENYGAHHGFWLASGEISQPCQGKCGDANNDNSVNVSDAVYVINFVFVGGAHPLPILACGDANGDGSINVSDAVYIINYVFVGGASPGNCSPGDPDWNGEDCCQFST